MNSSVLRGFCQKCGQSTIYPGNGTHGENGKIIPCSWVWFLSPQQMRTIYENWTKDPEGLTFARKLLPGGDWGLLYIRALEENPFLVAKILSASHSTEEGVKE